MRIQVLDHGYVQFVEAWGVGTSGPGHEDRDFYSPDFETGIIEAARQSTQGSFRGWDQDQKLLKFLYENKHATPFEFAGMTIEVQAPIFVFREWHRHRTQAYNEMSARYAPLPDLHYLPDSKSVHERAVAAMASKNRQASSTVETPPSWEDVDAWLAVQADLYAKQEAHYQLGLSIGIPKEMARIGMPVGHYSRMRACASLRNWLAFLTLRMAPNAQQEIREYANAVAEIVRAKFPRTAALFDAHSS